MILAMLLSVAAPAAATPATRIKALRCGAAELRMTSRMSASRSAPLAPVSQSLTRRVGPRQVPVTLEHGHGITVDGHRVRDRYIASWACVPGGRRMRYVLLGYACTADPGSLGDCGGAKEWFRLLDGRGRFVDAGVPRDGIARDRLNLRLGIADALAAGVTMTPVVE